MDVHFLCVCAMLTPTAPSAPHQEDKGFKLDLLVERGRLS